MSTEITIEPGESFDPVVCECCGKPIHRAHGFVYGDGDAYSVYHASWSPAHPARGANVALQFGDWSESAGPVDRYRVGLEIRLAKEEYQFGFIDPEQSVWLKSNQVRMLTRAEALGHPNRKEFFHVDDHVVFGDARLKAGVDGGAALTNSLQLTTHVPRFETTSRLPSSTFALLSRSGVCCS